MIIVSWNCAGAFRNKFTFLQNLLPDVCVVQECEDPTRSASDSYREWSANSLWTGDNKNRGLGIFAKPHIRLEPVALNANGLELFLPCRIDSSMTLLDVWTRRTKSYDFRYIGQLWKYLNLHAEALRTKTSIVMGDFNSNVFGISVTPQQVIQALCSSYRISGWKACITTLSRYRKERSETPRSSCSGI
jgi:hypothetical protein